MIIPGSANSLLLRSAVTQYQVSRSLRFNSSDSAYLSRAVSTAGDRKTFTFACWAKLSSLSTSNQYIFTTSPTNATNAGYLYYTSNQFVYWDRRQSVDDRILTTNAVYRDPSAWYHLVLSVNYSASTSTDRAKIYVNGVEQSYSGATYPNTTESSYFNAATTHYISAPNGYVNAYLADIHFIDGQALTPSSFTEVSATTGQLIPKKYTGTATGNSFWLPFSDNSAATATTLGKDGFLLGNNWTLNNIQASTSTNAITFGGLNPTPTIEYLVIAGGGGAGYVAGGGGGAGGMVVSNSPVSVSGSYSIYVGRGGAGGLAAGVKGKNGEDSFFGSIARANGGGGGGSSGTSGLSGGSGGGGGGYSAGTSAGGGSATQTSPTGGTGYGFAGGNASGSGSQYGAGGGGGAGGAGDNGVSVEGGPGGVGRASSITGTSVTYATGGYGGWASTGSGASGAANTGNGGSGGGTGANANGGSGGSGVVIIRYSNTYSDLSYISPSITYSFANTGGYKIYTFTSTPLAQEGDSLVDTPTSYGTDTGVGGEVRGNYCTLNPLNNGGVTLTNGNLDWQRTAGGSTAVAYSTIAVSSGKWYFETTLNGATSGVNWEFGVARVGTSNTIRPGTTANGWGLVSSSNTTLYKQNNNSLTTIFTGTLSNGDIIGIAIDLDNGRIWFARNNTWLEGSPSAGTGASYTNLSGTVAVFAGGDGSAVNGSFNAGARPFAYTAPSGFKALCDTNLPAPVVAKPSTVMDVKLYSGNSSTQTISGLEFSPDLVWCKVRSHAFTHNLFDSVRGANKTLYSNLTNAENTWTDKLTAFNSDGFSLGADATGTGECNVSGHTYVAWTWDAGSSTVTNTAGSITGGAQVRANASAGFSIVTYTGNGTTATVGHGLGVAPYLMIHKARNLADFWLVYHGSLGASTQLNLSSTSAAITGSTKWNSTAPSSTVFTVTNDGSIGQSGINYVTYCFAPVAGYSSAFSYTGTGAEGPMVWLNFRPKLVLIKRSDSTGSWFMFDSARSTYNETRKYLLAESSNAEGDDGDITNGWQLDFLSNGFKIRADAALQLNANGGTYVGFAWAESPFAYARAR